MGSDRQLGTISGFFFVAFLALLIGFLVIMLVYLEQDEVMPVISVTCVKID